MELEDVDEGKSSVHHGDLTGATETYRTIETKYADNLEAKEMLKNILHEATRELSGYLKARHERLRRRRGKAKSF